MEWCSDNTSSSPAAAEGRGGRCSTREHLSCKSIRDWKLPHADSGQNSLEYWDYSVELEMLNGPEDLQLAAELGKTLLERNRDLEATIKQQQCVIDDQAQEIEYLSKQTAALREVNDSRLRIYEQLEISIQDLEKNNQRLTAENSADKKRIKSLSSTIEQHEIKIVELQKSLEEAKSSQQQVAQQRGRTQKRKSLLISEEQLARRSQSCENTTQTSNGATAEELELMEKVEQLEKELKGLHHQRLQEAKKKEEIEIEMSCLSQENNLLQQQISILRDRDHNLRSLDEELTSIDDTCSSKICQKCLGLVDETESNNTMQDFVDDIEDFETSFENIHGDCALVKLKNGGYAWGSQESLASLGQVMNGVVSCTDSPSTDASEAPRNSLLSELDTQYRILIEKYESLIETRERQQQENQQIKLTQKGQQIHNQGQTQTIIDPGVDEMSGPMSIVMTTDPKISGNMGSMKCQRCTTCSCDLKPTADRPKSNNEEFSEVETTSSGFSEGEGRTYSKGTQTVDQDSLSTPTPTQISKCLDLPATVDPFENRFQATPEYKKLFHEIFTVLKETVSEHELDGVQEQLMESLKNDMTEDDLLQVFNRTKMSLDQTFTEENDENRNPNVDHCKPSGKKKKKKEKTPQKAIPKACVTEHLNEDFGDKPKRPDSLEIGNLSRSSSRQSRRRRRKDNKKGQEESEETKPLETHTQALLHNDAETNTKREIATSSKSLTEESIRKEASKETSGAHQKHHIVSKTNGKKLQDASKHPEHNRIDVSKNKERTHSRDHGDLQEPSSSTRCEHKQRKHKRRKQADLQQQLLQREHERRINLTTQYYNPSQIWNKDAYQNPTPALPKISHPSVEVAKLRQLEMSYAQALKSTLNRMSYERRY